MDYLERLPAPSSAMVNLGLTSPSEGFMLGILPDPRSTYTGDCQNPNNPLFQRLAKPVASVLSAPPASNPRSIPSRA